MNSKNDDIQFLFFINEVAAGVKDTITAMKEDVSADSGGSVKTQNGTVIVSQRTNRKVKKNEVRRLHDDGHITDDQLWEMISRIDPDKLIAVVGQQTAEQFITVSQSPYVAITPTNEYKNHIKPHVEEILDVITQFFYEREQLDTEI